MPVLWLRWNPLKKTLHRVQILRDRGDAPGESRIMNHAAAVHQYRKLNPVPKTDRAFRFTGISTGPPAVGIAVVPIIPAT